MGAKQKKELLIAGVLGVSVLGALIWFANQGGASASGPSIIGGPAPSNPPATYGGATFNIGGLPAGYVAQGVGATPSGADGGVTPSCQCPGAGTTYYGTPADQAGSLAALMASIAQYIGPPQNLALPPTPTTPTTNPAFTGGGFYGTVTPAQYLFGQRFGTSFNSSVWG
jgi:hypothetical protein